MSKMTRKERLESAFKLQKTDRTPILGGWIACPEYIMELAGAIPAGCVVGRRPRCWAGG